jgi:sec-independent protein translocase protein TatA
MYGIQPIHILVIIIVGLIVFGPKRLPEIGRSIGKGMNELKRGAEEMTSVLYDEMNNPRDVTTTKIAPAEDAVVTQDPAREQAAPASFAQTSNSAPGIAQNVCAQCGAQNVVEANFCNRCGSKFP